MLGGPLIITPENQVFDSTWRKSCLRSSYVYHYCVSRSWGLGEEFLANVLLRGLEHWIESPIQDSLVWLFQYVENLNHQEDKQTCGFSRTTEKGDDCVHQDKCN